MTAGVRVYWQLGALTWAKEKSKVMLQLMSCFCRYSQARMPSHVDAICITLALLSIDVYVSNTSIPAENLSVAHSRAADAMFI